MNYRIACLLAAFVSVSACVTVNVYFPESAAQAAADRFIRDVYGDDANQAPASAGENPQSWRDLGGFLTRGIVSVGNFIIAPASAQGTNINIATPAISSLKSSMSSRHQKLKSGYAAGAVGMATTGLIVLRDAKAIPLQQRNQIKQLVVQENQDRNKLYAEVARANNHPEWENEIRAIFARQWVDNAPAGWWYESGGSWKQK